MKKIFLVFIFFLVMLIYPDIVYASVPNLIRIGLTREFANRDSIHIANTQILAGYGSGGSFSASATLHSSAGFTARISGANVALYSNGERVHLFRQSGAQIIDAAGGKLQLGNYSYRGAIEFLPNGGRVTAINVLCPEEYLYGVLPSEVSYSFHIEALKAQAIASRTFMFYRTSEGSHSHQGFDLCDNIHCQLYRGAGREHANTTLAVNETHRQMIFHNNNLILAVYFASCGGVTDNSENVWREARPYLRAVRSVAEYDPPVWTRSFTNAELTAALINADANIGTATGMSVTNTSPYGRVQELTIEGTNGQWRLTSEAIRTFFSPIGGNLMSRNFYIAGTASSLFVTDGYEAANRSLAYFFWRNAQGEVARVQVAYIFDGTTTRRVTSVASVATGDVTINGRGSGHGVGMSQRGALGMALAGYNHNEILHHYYTDVEIR